MTVRSVQISLDQDLLEEIDRQPETGRMGRSAVIRRALPLYLDFKRRVEIDQAYARGYGSCADEVFREFADLLGGQRWPEE